MNGVNYLLLLEGNSNNVGPESSVRGFTRLEAAQSAMAESYRRYAAALNIPVSPHVFNDQYTTRTGNGIRLSRYGDWFRWKIIKAVPEDGDTQVGFKGKERYKMAKFTVTIEEHIAQEFSVSAHDLFHAIQTGEEQYKQGSFVVRPSTPNTRLIMARNEGTGETTEWKEF